MTGEPLPVKPQADPLSEKGVTEMMMQEPVKPQAEPRTIWVCPECSWTSSTYPPRGQCCSVKPHENYTMNAVEVVEKSSFDAAVERVERAEEQVSLIDDEYARRISTIEDARLRYKAALEKLLALNEITGVGADIARAALSPEDPKR